MNVMGFFVLFCLLVMAAQDVRTTRVMIDRHPVAAAEAWPLAADWRR